MPLEIIIGPMFSGKTSELLRRTDCYKSIGKNIFYINHKIDDRYGLNRISTHNNRYVDALSTHELDERR